MKRLELTDQEVDIVAEALTAMRRKFRGRAGWKKAQWESQETQAAYIETRPGVDPTLGEIYRRPIAEWKRQEEEYRAKAGAIAAVLAQVLEPDDPMRSFISQEVLDGVIGGKVAIVEGEDGQPAAAIVPVALHRIAMQVVAQLKGWQGPWTVARLHTDE